MRVRPETLEAVVFDLDGTLADTLPVVAKAFQLTLERFDLEPLSQIEIFEYFGPTEDGVIKAMFGEAATSAVPVFYSTYHNLLLNNIVPFDGVRDLLRACGDQGLRLAVVTGKSERGAEMTLGALDLVGMFEYVRGGSLSGVVKSREISGLLNIWNVSPDRAAYVGDHPLDVREARDAGVLALAAGWASTVDLGAIQDVRPDELFLTVEDFSKWLCINESAEG
jgi:phosphoglycolate phosphatase-like HAD superfamily hydrolase